MSYLSLSVTLSIALTVGLIALYQIFGPPHRKRFERLIERELTDFRITKKTVLSAGIKNRKELLALKSRLATFALAILRDRAPEHRDLVLAYAMKYARLGLISTDELEHIGLTVLSGQWLTTIAIHPAFDAVARAAGLADEALPRYFRQAFPNGAWPDANRYCLRATSNKYLVLMLKHSRSDSTVVCSLRPTDLPKEELGFWSTLIPEIRQNYKELTDTRKIEGDLRLWKEIGPYVEKAFECHRKGAIYR